MTTQPTPPLAGIRIVAVEQYGAGPYATLYLADMGADGVKVEDPAVGATLAATSRPVKQGQIACSLKLLTVAHPSMVPFQFFETADGDVAIACPKEKFFQMLVQAIGLPE
jgi:crotonobetainyl-CoA:carnitine CoA-transferase CaiB-like acyl-CoA transferase